MAIRWKKETILICDVILRRNNPNERLGLTLCYGITASATNIYIQDVEPGSVAYHSNGLQTGDQILKINNKEVKSRDEAIRLVQNVCIIILQIFRFQFQEHLPFPWPLFSASYSSNDDNNFKSVIKPNYCYTTTSSDVCINTAKEDDSGVVVATDTDHKSKSLNRDLNQHIDNTKYLPKPSSLNSHFEQQISSANYCSCRICRLIRSYSKQIRYRRCLSLNDFLLVHNDTTMSWRAPSRTVTEESRATISRSRSLIFQKQSTILKPLPFRDDYKNTESDEIASILIREDIYSHGVFANAKYDSDSGLGQQCEESTTATTVTTTDPLLSVTPVPVVLNCYSISPLMKPKIQPSLPAQWSFKYIGNRQQRLLLRNRILRAREKRILEERCLTTDEEYMSELKTGKYWTKNERKRHLQRAKEHRQRQKFMMKSSKLLSSSRTSLSTTATREDDYELLTRVFLRTNTGEQLKQNSNLFQTFCYQHEIEKQNLLKTHSISSTSMETSSSIDTFVVL
ncbi:unnamed protein product [Didymodactylos carnosus]|uniref:PDZ domain-containing protein n=1 Tax=Didymodactylos carnosus TaxID=1234261 RepID=A0A814HWW6_9BILA|nr:unnamed protein product [Didymodactylos carnosus]CAF3788687.1 unnamed protein product [Didymodactylos carnosus]